MKKAYSKPDIVFEDFSLSTNIAAGCEENPTNSTHNCGVKWAAGIFIFLSAETGCNRIIVDGSKTENLVDDENNGLCYHNPTVNYNVFIS